MSVLNGAIVLGLFFRAIASEIPLAPYSVKLYCRMGASGTIESRDTALCPTASTSCGFFEFETPTVPYPIGVYECVDSSVFVTENDDNEREKEDLFKRYCDDRSRCRKLTVDMLNTQFMSYLAKTQGVHVENPENARVKFCCAIDNVLLDKVISSGFTVLPTPTTKQVSCNGEKCNAGAIGCLVYSKEIEQSYVDEIILVRPVPLTYDDYDEQTTQQSSDELYAEVEYSNEYHCVHRHLNDELYRYCELVHNERLPGRCFEGTGYRVCCCFFSFGKATCDPLRQSTITTVAPPSPATSGIAYAFALSVSAVYTTTVAASSTTASAHTTVLPSFSSVQTRTPTTIPSFRLSDKLSVGNNSSMNSTTAQTHLHLNTSLNINHTSETMYPTDTAIVHTSMNPPYQRSIPDRNPLPVKPSINSVTALNISTTAQTVSKTTTLSTSRTKTTTLTITTASTVRMRCRTVIEDRSRFSLKKGDVGTIKKVVCDSEIDSAMSHRPRSAIATIILLLYVLVMPINT
ncbi:hypothetical protein Tcan_17837 [Toxocara canis]|uniref:Uncharacterized protein n=1 Tax=Toxocara canis TaxID=6265 RepID=A0A0B2VXB2_TOXCA|nr:hypothetical protein Tcan_17837 [Toxocara canis]